MLNQITLDKIRNLKLLGMLDAYDQLNQSQSLLTISFTEGLGLLVDQESLYRDNKRLARLQKAAKLRYPQALIEDINYEHKRTISHEQFRVLTSGKWLINHQNILLIGPTGVGKTYLACACAQLACRLGFTTRYFKLSKLFEAIRIAKADGSYSRLIAQLLKVQCLVIDDWGIDPINSERRVDLLEIIDDNYDQRSLIIELTPVF